MGNCKLHAGQKLKKFCESPNCWTQICPKCALEVHKGHRVIDWQSFISEAKEVKERLLQARSGDILSVKKMIEGTNNIKARLDEATEKRKTAAKDFEEKVVSKIREILKSTEEKSLRLCVETGELQRRLRELCDSQVHEIEKIPELADAVISHGTAEDLRTFFEMCQKGTEVNSEILEYKKAADEMKKTIEDFITANPFKFLGPFDEVLRPREVAMSLQNSDTLNSFVEDNELEVSVNESLRNFEGKISFADTFSYPSKENALPRINSSAGLYCKKDAKFSLSKNFINSQLSHGRGYKSNMRSYKSYNSQTHTRRNSMTTASKEAKQQKTARHQVNSSMAVEATKTAKQVVKKQANDRRILNKTVCKPASKSALSVRKPVALKKTAKKKVYESIKASVAGLKNTLKSVKQVLERGGKLDIAGSIREFERIAVGRKECFDVVKNFADALLSTATLKHAEQQSALSKSLYNSRFGARTCFEAVY